MVAYGGCARLLLSAAKGSGWQFCSGWGIGGGWVFGEVDVHPGGAEHGDGEEECGEVESLLGDGGGGEVWAAEVGGVAAGPGDGGAALAGARFCLAEGLAALGGEGRGGDEDDGEDGEEFGATGDGELLWGAFVRVADAWAWRED